MAKKKRKKKNRNAEEVTAMPVAARDAAAGISASVLENFSRDLSVFGSRPEKPDPGRPVG